MNVGYKTVAKSLWETKITQILLQQNFTNETNQNIAILQGIRITYKRLVS